MKEYAVRITEVLEKTVIVEAPSAREAKYRVKVAWQNGDYILGAEHFQGAIFTLARR